MCNLCIYVCMYMSVAQKPNILTVFSHKTSVKTVQSVAI